MFDWFKNIFAQPTTLIVKDNLMSRIVPLNGRFAIIDGGTVLKTYSRRRDAVRGAARLGVNLEQQVGG